MYAALILLEDKPAEKTIQTCAIGCNCFKMLQKLSKLTTTDHSGAGWLQIFHLYRGFWRRYAYIGDYTKSAVKTIAFYPRHIKGKRYRPLRVGYVVRGLIVRSRKPNRFVDNTRLWAFSNNSVLLKKRGVFKTKHIYGPVPRTLNKKHHLSLFNYVV